jgi:ABC-type transport system involved in multi-copper enzyme maturation permease subunit
VTIYLPDYSLPPPALLPRAARIRAILREEIVVRSRAVNFALLALIYLVVVAPIVVTFYLDPFLGALGSAPAPITLFFAPYGEGIWAFFLVLLATSVGAAIIARDLASRSITMYLSRPITHLDYLLGKAGAAGFWIALGALGPGLVATAIVLALGYVSLPVALLAAAGFLVVGLLAVGALTGLTLLLSALASRSTYAGAGIFGALLGAEAIATVLSDVSGNSGFLYLSPFQDIAAVAQSLFGVTGDPLDPWAAAGLLIALAIGTGALAYLRLAGTEVVSE